MIAVARKARPDLKPVHKHGDGLLLMQQTRFPPGALGLAAISAIDHCLWDISAKALGVPVYSCSAAMCATGEGLCRRLHRARPAAARDEFDKLNEQWGLTAFKLSPWRIDMHRNRWGEVVRASAEYFRAAPRDGALRLRDRLRRARQDLRAVAGHPTRQRARALRSAVLRGAAAAGELRRLGRGEARAASARWRPANRSTAASSSCACCRYAGPTSSSPTSASSAA